MDEDEFLRGLSSRKKPDAVLITSMMTYWYPGVSRAVELLRQVYGEEMPVILGGIYATLCPEHAQQISGADHIYTGDDLRGLVPLVARVTGKQLRESPVTASFASYPLPSHDIAPGRRFIAVLTGRGCPFRCTYCASHLLNPRPERRSVQSVLSEIQIYTALVKTNNVAFYDDALLDRADEHIVPLLDALSGQCPGLSLHLPNGIHSRYMNREMAVLFRSAGVRTIRIGLETADERLQRSTGNKTGNEEYRAAVAFFRDAGFSRKEVGTYVMLGLPGQKPQDVQRTIDFVYRAGAAPHISYFSPIPGTQIWEESAASTPFPVEEEPLFQNNTVFILGSRRFSERTIGELKQMAVASRKLP
jgi:radical SAM superfamily enzyme YgiQ (UPF0313 family)